MNLDCSDCSDFSLPSEDENTKILFKLKQKNQKLSIINQDLLSKNQILNEQIERTLKMNTNIEETFKKHNNTVKELIAVRAEKEDLENRLRLSLQANEELKLRLRKYFNENSSSNLNPNSTINDNFEKKTSFIQDKTNSVKEQNSQIDLLKKQILALEKHNSELSEQIIELSQSQERSNNQQLGKQSSEIFDNILISPSQNQRSTILDNDDQFSNISLRNERDKMMNLLNRQNDLTSNLELKLKKANDEIEELREKNRSLTKDVMKKGQLADSYELNIPDSVFSSAEFPLDLENMVSGIYKNPTLQITTKIRQIISVVTHYFKSKYEQIERDLKESKENAYKLTEKTNSLTDFLHQIIPSQNVNYNALLDDEQARKSLGEAVNHIKNKLHSVQQEKEELKEHYEEMLKQMKSNTFQELSNSIANLQTEHKEFKQFKKETKNKEEEFAKTIKELETAKQFLEENFEKQKMRAKSLKVDFENQMQNLKDEHSNQVDELNNKYEKEIQQKNQENDELKQQNDKLKIELDEANKMNQNHLIDFNSQKDTFLQDIEKLKHVIKQLRIRKEKREREIDFLKQQNADNENEIREKLKNQKNEIQARFEQMQQIRSKEAKEYSQNIANLKIEIEKLIKERDELLVKNTNLSINLQKLETTFNAFSANRERERSEFESRMMAQRQMAQTEIASKENELKAQLIESKRQLFQNFFKQLAPLVNFGSSFNESNMNSLILDVRRKIETILAREARLREMLSINAYESIEEALTKKINHLTKRKKTRIEI